MPKSRRQTKSQDGVADQKSEAIGADQKSEAVGADQKSEAVGRYHQPSARECALLILRLMQAREQELLKAERCRGPGFRSSRFGPSAVAVRSRMISSSRSKNSCWLRVGASSALARPTSRS